MAKQYRQVYHEFLRLKLRGTQSQEELEKLMKANGMTTSEGVTDKVRTGGRVIQLTEKPRTTWHRKQSTRRDSKGRLRRGVKIPAHGGVQGFHPEDKKPLEPRTGESRGIMEREE